MCFLQVRAAPGSAHYSASSVLVGGETRGETGREKGREGHKLTKCVAECESSPANVG